MVESQDESNRRVIDRMLGVAYGKIPEDQLDEAERDPRFQALIRQALANVVGETVLEELLKETE